MSDYDLFETLLWNGSELTFKDAHGARLARSADELGFSYEPVAFESLCKDIARNAKAGAHERVRITLKKDGTFSFMREPIDMHLSSVKVTINPSPVESKSRFLVHKTTYRPWYERALQRIETSSFFDVLFFNERNEMTEGARSNIFFSLNGKRYTPPRTSGLLPGILRQTLIATRECEERLLLREELNDIDEIYIGNSVRGLLRVSHIEE